MHESTKLNIKSWAEEDRPREKLLNKGSASLSDAELLAILLRSGSREETAVGLAQRVLLASGNDLNELGRQPLTALTKFKGLGETKALTILAALELGRRRQLSDVKDRPVLRSSRDAYNAISGIIADLPYEEFWLLMINRGNRIIGRERISMGGVSGTVVDAKIVFKCALDNLATSIVLCHNHPSGNVKPSEADIQLTEKLKKAGKVLDIAVLDHIIVGQSRYYSFADEGIMT